MVYHKDQYLGPLVFLIYINDVSAVSADDTNFFIQVENLEKMENYLIIELKKITIGLKTNTFSLHIKTHTMTFSNTHSIRTRHNKIYITYLLRPLTPPGA